MTEIKTAAYPNREINDTQKWIFSAAVNRLVPYLSLYIPDTEELLTTKHDPQSDLEIVKTANFKMEGTRYMVEHHEYIDDSTGGHNGTGWGVTVMPHSDSVGREIYRRKLHYWVCDEVEAWTACFDQEVVRRGPDDKTFVYCPSVEELAARAFWNNRITPSKELQRQWRRDRKEEMAEHESTASLDTRLTRSRMDYILPRLILLGPEHLRLV